MVSWFDSVTTDHVETFLKQFLVLRSMRLEQTRVPTTVVSLFTCCMENSPFCLEGLNVYGIN